jgi:hypothetical protein
MGWADLKRGLKVRANADTPNDARVAMKFGTEGHRGSGEASVLFLTFIRNGVRSPTAATIATPKLARRSDNGGGIGGADAACLVARILFALRLAASNRMARAVRHPNAAVQILLPLAAVAFGMTAFGIVLYFTAHSAV